MSATKDPIMNITPDQYFPWVKATKGDEEIYENPETWKKRTRYYMTLFERFEKKEKKYLSLNFPAMIFTSTWFVYRRMYLYALVVPFSFVLLSVFFFIALSSIFNGVNSMWVGWFILFFVYFVCGCVGNYLYFYHVRQKIKKGKNPPPKGTNIVGAVIVAILFMMFSKI